MHNRILAEKREMSDACITHISADLSPTLKNITYAEVYLRVLNTDLDIHSGVHDQLREDGVLQDKK